MPIYNFYYQHLQKLLDYLDFSMRDAYWWMISATTRLCRNRYLRTVPAAPNLAHQCPIALQTTVYLPSGYCRFGRNGTSIEHATIILSPESPFARSFKTKTIVGNTSPEEIPNIYAPSRIAHIRKADVLALTN